MQAIKEALGKFMPESSTVIPYKGKHVEAYVEWFTGKDQSPDFSTGENGFQIKEHQIMVLFAKYYLKYLWEIPWKWLSKNKPRPSWS